MGQGKVKVIINWPTPKRILEVETDASGIVIGVVLSQKGKPLSYYSEKLNQAKQKYSSYDREFYVIIQTLKKQRQKVRYTLKEELRATEYEEATHEGLYTGDEQSFETDVKIEKDE